MQICRNNGPPNYQNYFRRILVFIVLNTQEERNKIIYQSIHGYVMSANDDIYDTFSTVNEILWCNNFLS